MHPTHRLAAFFVCLLLSLPGQAARQFDIEVLIFARAGGDRATNEVWPGDPGTLNWDRSIRLESGQLLPRAGWRLNAERHALTRSTGRMDKLIHQAWRQSVLDRRDAQAVYLKSSDDIAPGTPRAEGLVTVSVNRYLHVDLDFLMRERSGGDQPLSGSFRTVRIIANRRMRSGELHYIDHPMMGVLIEISPVGR